MMDNYKQFYKQITKQGIQNSLGVPEYLKEAVYYKNAHDLVSAIDQNDWLYFTSIDPRTNSASQYVATLTQDLNAFNLYKRYEHSIKQVAIIPIKDVFTDDTIKKYHLGIQKPKKSATSKAKSKPKSDTSKPRKKTRTKRVKKSTRTRKGHKTSKSSTRRAKK